MKSFIVFDIKKNLYESVILRKMDDPKFVAPGKTYNEGDIIADSNMNLEKVYQSDQLLKTKTESIDIGFIDPNKSLHLGDTQQTLEDYPATISNCY